MKYYLVDYENTKKEDLIGISSLSKKMLYVFSVKKSYPTNSGGAVTK